MSKKDDDKATLDGLEAARAAYAEIGKANGPESLVSATAKALRLDPDVDCQTGAIVQAIITVGIAQMAVSREQYADSCRRSDVISERNRTALAGQAEMLAMQRAMYDLMMKDEGQ